MIAIAPVRFRAPRGRRRRCRLEPLMEPCTLEFIAEACQARWVRGDPALRIQRVCTDSRQVLPGDLFVALRGPNFDGHQFVSAAVAGGAVAVLVESGWAVHCPEGCAVLEVDDTRAALGRWAARHRQQFDIPVVAVAGANGKTSTKELLAAVLSQHGPTLWSQASFNNDVGVPLTLLRLERKHWAAVLEAGTNHPGELRPLLEWIRPWHGIFTGVGREHLEFFGDLAGVAREEGTLAEVLPAEGLLVLNGDDPWAGTMIERTRARVIRVGLGSHNDWRVKSVHVDWSGTEFEVEGPVPAWAGKYRTRLLGGHQARNAVLALVMGHALGVSADAARQGLARCAPPPHRMETFQVQGVWVLDDCYNANPDSMLASLETFVRLPCSGRRVAVLGEMAELGAHAEAAHAEVGRRAAELGVEQLFAVGPWAAVMGAAARAAGLMRVLELTHPESVAGALRQFLRAGDVVLIKASRRMRLEQVVDGLRADAGRDA